MKRSINRSILLAIAISCFATVMPEDKQSAWQKTKSFLRKHKKKIVAGVAAAAAIGITLGLAYHGDKTMKAIEKAGMSPSDDKFGTAVAAVGLLGPLGERRAINTIMQAQNRGILSAEQAATLVFSKIGSALAAYWGITHTKFMANAIRMGIKDTLKKTWEGLREAIKDMM